MSDKLIQQILADTQAKLAAIGKATHLSFNTMPNSAEGWAGAWSLHVGNNNDQAKSADVALSEGCAWANANPIEFKRKVATERTSPHTLTFAQWKFDAIDKARTTLSNAITGSDSAENIQTLCGSEGVMIFAFNNGETPAEHIFMQWHELGLQFSEGQAIHLTLPPQDSYS